MDGIRPSTGSSTRGRGLATGLLVGMLLISGSPLMYEMRTAVVLLLLAATVALSSTLRAVPGWQLRCLILSGAFLLIILVHRVSFGFVSWPANLFLLFKVVLSAYVIWAIGPRVIPGLLNATTLLALLSFPPYLLLLLTGPQDFPTFFSESVVGDNLKSVVVLTVHMTPEWWRNSGPVWEPGAYQGIINLTFLLTPARTLISSRHRWKVLVLLLALLTTFSTTGYIALFLVLVYKLLRLRRLGLIKVPLVAAVLAISVMTYLEADFLGEKIAQQVANTQIREDFTPDRFGALLFDLHYIEKNPWFGNGMHEATRFADHPHLHGEPLGHGNGLSNFIATMGYFGLLVYLTLLWFSRTGWNNLDRSAVSLVLMLLVFGEQFMMLPLFLGLPFLRLVPIEPARRRPQVLSTSLITTRP
ncbi:MAG: hypothetical protein JNJ71_02660 [Rubrivivax sp.]|nr:hypothetical protein [Rubrivivax sp.]